MNWVETIRVQTEAGRDSAAEKELMKLTDDFLGRNDCPGLVGYTVYRHGTVPGLFAVRLFWRTDRPQIEGSRPGLHLKQSLKAFGLVDHAVWIEESPVTGAGCEEHS